MPHLKALLDDFSAAAGLNINFNKSTIVPMHVDNTVLLEFLDTLSYQCESFLQTYLGLPLSNAKLTLNAFAPLISKADRYLSGWQASLLSPMGCAVLVNSVLDSLVTYTMAALQLPHGVINLVNSKR